MVVITSKQVFNRLQTSFKWLLVQWLEIFNPFKNVACVHISIKCVFSHQAFRWPHINKACKRVWKKCTHLYNRKIHYLFSIAKNKINAKLIWYIGTYTNTWTHIPILSSSSNTILLIAISSLLLSVIIYCTKPVFIRFLLLLR